VNDTKSKRVGDLIKKPEARAEQLEDGHWARHLLEVEVTEGRDRDVKLWESREEERGVGSWVKVLFVSMGG
jgi:hypothetical protein